MSAEQASFLLARDSLLANEVSSGLHRIRRRGYQRYVLWKNFIDFSLLWKRRWFIIAMFLGFALMTAPTPAGLTHQGQIVLCMSLISTILFASEAVPLPTVPLLIIVGEVVLLGIDPTVVAQSLMTDSVLFIMGSLMLAVAVVKQRLDKRIAWWIVRITGTNLYAISFGLVVVCGLLAAFIGEHTVAAMMLPVGVTLISLTSNEPTKVRNVAAVLLFSICYGCSIAGVATPSGGARNAIMISYWKSLFFNPEDPATNRYIMDYLHWALYAFPMFLLRLPFVTLLLAWTFKPETTDMTRSIARLRTQVAMQGPMRGSEWMTILIFGVTITAWVGFSQHLGLGTIAIAGTAAFLIFGLVRWEDINAGVNWGVIWLYAAAISLGVEMKATGAAEWVAHSMLHGMQAVNANGLFPFNFTISVLTIFVSNTMTAGAAVAVLAPIVLNTAVASGHDPLATGFLSAISSAFGYLTPAAQPAFTIVYASGYLKASDFMKIGVRMMILSFMVLMLLAQYYWPQLS
ncbi:SLC13 family permease [Aestuariivirga litoralis]|uniref:SLC13 family permease n=1 Tax=Aestuariivirga litoralis TaxID=2650924 RepID=UPI0018C74AC0|nr:DASS family sodium-coupled anion symporter [Aestuariivirga litoralis]MBG1232282.1 DASS family sodium-coupled anion symporter [Aestuariivirga litoralis]